MAAELGGPEGPDPEGPEGPEGPGLFRDLPPVKPVMLFPFCATTVLPVAVPVFTVPALAASPRLDLGAHISPVNSTPSSTSPGSFSRRLLSLLARLPLGCDREAYVEFIEFAAAWRIFNDLTTSAGGRGDMSGAGNPVLDGELKPLEPLEPFFGEWPSLEGESGVLDGEAPTETFGDAFGDASLID